MFNLHLGDLFFSCFPFLSLCSAPSFTSLLVTLFGFFQTIGLAFELDDLRMMDEPVDE